MKVAILSGIHGNYEALRAVLYSIGTVDKLVVGGDIVGYGPQPIECIALLKEYEAISVLGNHDLAVLGKKRLEWFNPYAKASILWTQNILDDASIRYLESLTLKYQIDSTYWVVHASPKDYTDEYILSIGQAEAALRHISGTSVFIGHTHIPCIFREEDKVTVAALLPNQRVEIDGSALINVGSVGQPRDYDPRASYILLDTENSYVELYRVEYDIKKTQTLMLQAHLPEYLIWRLELGI